MLTFSLRYQVLAGIVPYGKGEDDELIEAITKGVRPPKTPDSSFPGGIWEGIEKCWTANPIKRREIAILRTALSAAADEIERNRPTTTRESRRGVSLLSGLFTRKRKVEERPVSIRRGYQKR